MAVVNDEKMFRGADIRYLASLFGWGNLFPQELAEAERQGIARKEAEAWERKNTRKILQPREDAA